MKLIRHLKETLSLIKTMMWILRKWHGKDIRKKVTNILGWITISLFALSLIIALAMVFSFMIVIFNTDTLIGIMTSIMMVSLTIIIIHAIMKR